MSIMDRKHIDVLSYEPNVVVVPTVNNRSYVFRAADGFDDPVVIPIPPDEITYINSNCSAFKSGILRFRDKDKDEMYEELGIKDMSQMLYIEEVDDMLLNPSLDNLTKLVKISDSGQFERVRGRYYWLVNNDYSLENKVGQIIDKRYAELRVGKKKSDIAVTPIKKKEEQAVNAEELLEKQKKELDAQYAEKYAAMEAMMARMEAMLAASGVTSVAQAEAKTGPAKESKKTRTTKTTTKKVESKDTNEE